jgi:hypothetical protein
MDEKKAQRLKEKREAKRAEMQVKATRNAQLVEEHGKRYRNVSFFSGRHEKLLDKPAGMYALDYTPPKYRVDNAFLRGSVRTVTPKVIKPVRIKDYDRTPDPEVVRMDDVRIKRMFD